MGLLNGKGSPEGFPSGEGLRVPPHVIAYEAPLSYHVVMLNLFQHLSFQHLLFQCINLEIPKQVRNDRESSPIVIASPALSGRGNLSVSPPPRDCFVAIAPRNDSGKGSPEGFPSGGGLRVSPRYKKSLKIGGLGG